MNMPRYRIKKAKRPKSSVKSVPRNPAREKNWNENWNVTQSKNNKVSHPFYR